MEDKSQRQTWVRLEKMEGGTEKEMFDSTTQGQGSRGGSADGVAAAGDGSELRPSVDGKAGKDLRFLPSGTTGYCCASPGGRWHPIYLFEIDLRVFQTSDSFV